MGRGAGGEVSVPLGPWSLDIGHFIPMNSPQDLANAALVAFLKSVMTGDGYSIVTALETADKSNALVIVSAHQGHKESPYTGNYVLDLGILVKTVISNQPGVDPTLDTSPVPFHRLLTAAVWATFKGSAVAGQSKLLCAAINAACAAAVPPILFTAVDIHEKLGQSIYREFTED